MKILVLRTFHVDIFERKLELLLRQFKSADFFIVADPVTIDRFRDNERLHLFELTDTGGLKNIALTWYALFKNKFDLVFYGYDLPGGRLARGKNMVLIELFISLLSWKQVKIYTTIGTESVYRSRILFFLRTIWRLILSVFGIFFVNVAKIANIKINADELKDKLFFNGQEVFLLYLIIILVMIIISSFNHILLLLLAAIIFSGIIIGVFSILFSDIPFVYEEVPDLNFFDNQLSPDPLIGNVMIKSDSHPIKKTIGEETRNCFSVSPNLPLELSLEIDDDTTSLKLGVAADDGLPKAPSGKFEVTLGPQEASSATVDQRLGLMLKGWNDYEIKVEEFAKGEFKSLDLKAKISDSNGKFYISYPNIIRRRNSKKNIVVIIVDGLRRDHLGLYNKTSTITPSMDKFFRNRLIYNNAVTQEIWTKPSFASIMTGLYASHHGVVGKHFFQHLPEKHPLLAEIMRKNGYHTFAYISHRLANQLYGYSRGFDRFIWRQTGRKASFNHIDGIMAAYEALLNNEMTNNFVFLHLFDTHIPFFPRSPYHYINNTKILESIQVLAHKQRFAQDVPEEIKRYYRASYKNKIREVDMFLDILLEKIASTTLSENTSVILTSDHGETMFENNCCLEDGSYNLLNERIEVPLLAHFPGVVKEGMTIDGYVEASVDIYPTILELAGIKTDTPYYAKSFLPDKKKGAVGKDFAISELIYKRGYQVTIQTKTLKYHRVCKRNPADGYISPEPSYESLVELRDHKEPRTNLLENDEGLKDSFVKIMRDLYLAEHYKESDYYKRCVSQYVY